MIAGLFLWEWGTIITLSIFTFGIPKSKVSLFFRLFCSLLILIPLTVTFTSLPLRTLISANGDYIVTYQGKVIAVLIICSGLMFLFTSIYLF